QVSARADDRRIVAAELEQHAPEALSNLWTNRPPHCGRARRRDQRDPRIVDQRLAHVAFALHELHQPGRRVAELLERPAYEHHHRFGAERRLLARLPDYRIAADQRERGIPRPHRDREVEGADHQHRPERVPLLHHPMLRTLAGDSEAVELARQAHREVADVDHLLHFAERFLDDLGVFQRDDSGQPFLRGPQLLAEEPHKLAPARRWYRPPFFECLSGLCGGCARVAHRYPANLRAVDRGAAHHFARALDSELSQQLGHFLRRRHDSSSLALAIAATPASIVSSFLPKHRRTRWRGGSCSAKADNGTTAMPAFSTAAMAKLSSSIAIPDAARSTQRKYVDAASST